MTTPEAGARTDPIDGGSNTRSPIDDVVSAKEPTREDQKLFEAMSLLV